MYSSDLVIIGGGPGGLTAGLYAARAKMDCLLLERLIPGGQILNTHWIENWPGEVQGISGLNLADRLRDHALRFGLNIKNIEVNGLYSEGEKKIIITSKGKIKTKAVILALGASPRKLGIPGEVELMGRGVSYCGTCDGPFFQNQVVIVVGGGNTAAEEAIFLSKFASKVYIVHRRDNLRSCLLLTERIKANPKIEILWSHEALAIEGDQKIGVNALRLKNLKINKEIIISAEGIFIFVGTTPNTTFLNNVIELDKEGYIKTDLNMHTSLPGIFAIGDCRASLIRQIVVAAGDGAVASYAAQLYLEKFHS